MAKRRKPKPGQAITLKGDARLSQCMLAHAANHEERPSGTVRFWRRNGTGWKMVRELAKPVPIRKLRTVQRGAGELLEFTPLGGRGGPMVIASPELLDAWHSR